MSIKRFTESCMEGGGVAPSAHGAYVEYADHVQSHAYDEAKERELFERWHGDQRMPSMDGKNRFMTDQDGEYWFIGNRKSWAAWQACAKSRARSAE